MSMLRQEALTALILSPPIDWLTRDRDGTRIFHKLHAQLARAGLTTALAHGTDVTKLHAIFDVSLQEGCGEVIVDWIVEVCGNPAAASADPLEAHLLDGCCVQQWAGVALQQCQARIKQALQQGLAAKAAPEVVHREAGRLSSLLHVSHALSSGDITFAQQLATAAEVAAWVTRSQPLAATRWGSAYRSHAEWRAAVNKRRDAVAPRKLLIHGLLEELRQQGYSPPSYPFASLEEVFSLFMSGSPTASHTQLAVVVYALTDAGFTVKEDSMRTVFDVKAGEVASWIAAVSLDHASCGTSAAEALATACQTVPSGLMAQRLGFEAVAALDRAGAPDMALAAARCRQPGNDDPASTDSLVEAQILLQARLSCGLLSEAVVEAARFLESPVAPQFPSAAAVLAEHLAGWAASARHLQSLAMLPLPETMEDAMVQSLKAAIAQGLPGSSQLPIFLLQRGHLAEADAASFAVEDALAAGILQEADHETQARRTVILAARQLLPAAMTSSLVSMRFPASQHRPHQHVAFGHEAHDVTELESSVNTQSQASSGLDSQSSDTTSSQLSTEEEEMEESGNSDDTKEISSFQSPMLDDSTGSGEIAPGRSTGPHTRQMAKRQRVRDEMQ